MNRQMDRTMKELHQFLNDHANEEMSMEEINALLGVHIKEMNARKPEKLTEKTAETADDFMELAEEKLEEGDELGALRLARKALKLDPDNLDAEWFVIRYEEKDPEVTLSKIRTALESGKANLEKQGYFDKDNIGHFWQIFETRPYIRLKNQYVFCLAAVGKLKLAAREAEDIIYLNEDDNTGVRFRLMHLYAALEDAKAAEKLLKKYSEHDEGPLLLAMILLYYKLDETDQAEKYLRRLTKIIKDTRNFVRDVLAGREERILSELEQKGGYCPFSEEELVMTYDENSYVYDTVPVFFRWMAKALKL